MARTSINTIKEDPISDSGSILWSFVKGEQLEFPITLNFLTNALSGYTYEAVVVEGLNVANQLTAPLVHKPAGVQTTLTVRVPTDRGTWDSGSAYNREEVVLYSGTYYRLLSGTARINATTPNLDPLWAVTVPNKIYVQFPASLASTWEVSPIVSGPVYGFFELRVTEPGTAVYVRTWKPVRGMVEILFSPTDIVA